MKAIVKSMALLFALIMISCGGKKEEKKEEGFSVQRKKAQTEQPAETSSTDEVKPSERVDMTTKGVGPVTSVELSAEIDQAMAENGKRYMTKCAWPATESVKNSLALPLTEYWKEELLNGS